ncbi:MAG: hypothetical protein PHW65_06080 [Dehalococcoidales bacterium]|nr:hypothetical protein [Dehalococcoidales bacterium]
MKTSLVIIDGASQVVLTPETAFERRIIGEIDTNKGTKVLKRSFFTTYDGIARVQPDDTPDDHEDKSLVITIGGVEI